MRFVLPGLAAMFVLAGGGIHLREWLDTYRSVPSSAAGALVVRAGFPVNAAVSVLLTIVLLLAASRLPVSRRPWLLAVVGGAIVFEVASAGALVVTRYGSLLGWREMGWSPGATAAIAVEAAAVALLGLWLVRPRLLLQPVPVRTPRAG